MFTPEQKIKTEIKRLIRLQKKEKLPPSVLDEGIDYIIKEIKKIIINISKIK